MPPIPCPGCPRHFEKERSLMLHFQAQPSCYQCQADENRTQYLLRSHAASSRAAAAPTEAVLETTDTRMLGEASDDDDDPPNDPFPEEDTDDQAGNSITSLHERHLKFLSDGYLKVPFNKELRAQTELVTLIQRHKLPFKMYDEFMCWHKSIQDLGTLNFHATKDANVRETVLKNLKTRYGLNDEPNTTTYILPASGEEVQVTTHDFKDQLYSLLTDPELMKDENLLFCDDDVFGVPTATKSGEYMMKDVIDGSVYLMAHNEHVKVPNRDILVPPLIFADKTWIDVKGRLTIEPISFTLGILTKEARKLPSAWRPLGYISNMSNLTTNVPLEKARDYHFILKKCLQSFVDVQQTDGIDWVLSYKNEDHFVRMKFPLLVVVDDTEGHDKCCGRKMGRSKMYSLCRYCTCPTISADIPTSIKKAGWKYVNGPDIYRLVANKDIAKLDELGYHPLDNAFNNVVFCDPKRGINGASPGEVLHVIQHGLCPYLQKGQFGTKRVTKPKKPSKKKSAPATAAGRKAPKKTFLPLPQLDDSPSESESSNGDDSDSSDDVDSTPTLKALAAPVIEFIEASEEPGEGEKFDIPPGLVESAIGVFSPLEQKYLNQRAIGYGSLLRHQSDRTWERSYFSTGITSDAKKNGHEERCIMLLLLLIFCSKDGGIRFDATMGKDRLGGFVHVLSQMLLLEHFLRLDQYPKKDEAALEKYMPLFLAAFKKAVNRKVGNGLKIIKFHLPLHWGGKNEGDLHRFGPASSTDSSAGESMHKDFKDAGRRTQKNTAKFEQQIAKNYNHAQVIHRAAQELKPPASPQPPSSQPTSRGLHFTVSEGGLYDHKKRNNNEEPSLCTSWHNQALCTQVVDLIQTKILPMVEDDSIHLKVMAKCDGDIYRADPSTAPAPRHDWVNVQFGSEVVPARIITFFDVTKDEGSNPINCGNESWIHNSGPHAIVQRLEQDIYSVPLERDDENYLAHQESSIVYWSRLLASPSGSSPLLFGVELAEHFHSPAAAVPYDFDDETEMEWLVVSATVEWHSIFQDDMEVIVKQAKEVEKQAKVTEKKRKAEARNPQAEKKQKS